MSQSPLGSDTSGVTPPPDHSDGAAARPDPPLLAAPRLDVWVEPFVVHVGGEIDAATVSDFRWAIALCDRDPTLHAINLCEVSFFSAAGVRALVEAEWPTRPHVNMIVSPIVRRVLHVCELSCLLDCHGWRYAGAHDRA